MNLPLACGIYAASLIASRATLKRHECRAPSVRFMVAMRDSDIVETFPEPQD